METLTVKLRIDKNQALRARTTTYGTIEVRPTEDQLKAMTAEEIDELVCGYCPLHATDEAPFPTWEGVLASLRAEIRKHKETAEAAERERLAQLDREQRIIADVLAAHTDELLEIYNSSVWSDILKEWLDSKRTRLVSRLNGDYIPWSHDSLRDKKSRLESIAEERTAEVFKAVETAEFDRRNAEKIEEMHKKSMWDIAVLAFLAAHGEEDMIARFGEGLLPEEELLDKVRNVVLKNMWLSVGTIPAIPEP
jgi:hypothetical protein